MRIKLVLIASLALVAALSLAPSASAATHVLKVFVKPAQINICRPTPDQLRFNFQFTAKITRRHEAAPKSVGVTFKVTDNATGGVISSGRSTLTPRNKFKNMTGNITVTTGQSLVYDLALKFKVPSTGKTVKSKSSQTDQVPTTAQIDSKNAANPAAPAFPNCV